MSARPSVPRIEGDDLDLLISRSLDGDLSPEETRDLETVLANDPAGRRRRDDLAALVAEARQLPVPAPPFALSTRVNANVSEKASRGGSLFHRFGFYPPPGLAIGAMVALGLLAVGITILNPPPKKAVSTLAARVAGPVEVFFQGGAREARVAAPAVPAAPAADRFESEKKRAEATDRQKSLATNETAKTQRGETRTDAGSLPAAKLAAGAVDAREDSRRSLQEPASIVAGGVGAVNIVNAPAPGAPEPAMARPSLAAATETAASDSAAFNSAASGALQASAATAPSRIAGREAPAWGVSIRGEGARHWMLRRAPEGRPSVSRSAASSFRVTLDADGRVVAVRPLDARASQPALIAFVRGLVFSPIGSAGGFVGQSGASTRVADNALRERDQKAKDEKSDTLLDKSSDKPADAGSEIEVEVSTR